MKEHKEARSVSFLFKLMSIISTVVVATSLIFTLLLVEYRTNDLIEREDSRLLMAAELSREMIGPSYHDQIHDETSVSKEQFQQMVARNDDLCRRLGLQYLWSVLVVEDRFVFTSATHSDLNDPNSHCASFFEPHRDPQAFAPAMQPELKPSFSSFKNEWGEGRMVLVPRKDALGRIYIFGASVQLTGLNEMIRRTIISSVGIGLGVFSVAVLFALLLARSFTLPIARLTKAADHMATGDLNLPLALAGTRELQSLSNSLDQMRQGLIRHLDALRQSEEKYRGLFEAESDAIFLIDNDTGLILEANDSASALYGYTREELLEKRNADVSEEPETTQQATQKSKDVPGQVVTIPVRYHRKKDGTVFPVEITARSFSWHGKSVHVAAIRDITERKQAEEALRESEDKHRRLFETMAQGVVYQAPDGTIITANPATERILGLSLDQIMGRTSADPGWRAIREDGSEFPGEEHPSMVTLRTGRPSGPTIMGVFNPVKESYSWLLVTAIPLLQPGESSPFRVYTTFEDITEHKRIEDALAQSEEHFRSVVEGSPDAIFVQTQGFFAYLNAAALKLFGATSVEQLLGKPVMERFHPDYHASVRERIRLLDEEKQAVPMFEQKYLRIDGTPVEVEVQAVPFSYENRDGAAVFIRDITERKRVEEALQKSNHLLDTIVENIPNMIFLKDAKDLTFVRSNKAGENLTGYTRDDLLGKSDYDLFTKEQADFFTEKDRHVLHGRELVDIPEESLLTRDGEIRHLHTKKVPLFDANGEPEYLLGIYEDITERKKVDEKLQETLLFQHETELIARVGGWKTNPETDVLLWTDGVNHILEESPDYKPGLEEGLKFYLPEYIPLLKEALLKALRDGTTFAIETEIMTANTKRLWAEVRGLRRIAEGEETFIVGTFQDITESKRAEQALILVNQQLNDIIEFLPDATFVIDREGRVIAWNRAIEEMTGISKKEMIGKGDYEYTLPFYGERRPQLLDLIGVSNEELESTYRFIQRKGNILSAEAYVPCVYRGKGAHVFATGAPLLDTHGDRVGAIESIRDITAYKEAEAALKESQQRLADIINFLPDATFVIDRDGKVIAWNRAIEAMTGVKAEEMMGKGNYEYSLPFYGERRPILIDLALHPNPEIERNYTAIQRRGDTIFGEAYTPSLPSGNAHSSATASVLRDSKGEIVAAIECIRDNTERKGLEERLQRAEKMEALGTLAGGVAHDLNNVLGIVVGYSELLLDDLGESSSARSEATEILKGGQRAAAIVQDLLTLARRGVHGKKVLNLNNIVKESQKTPEFSQLLSYHSTIEVSTDFELDLLNIAGSSVHLTKSLFNLLSNAAEAMPRGGNITIKTRNQYLDKPVLGYDEVKDGDYVVLSISDTGEGISASDLKRIFEPFYTKKVMGRSGTGLGLAVVWGTVKDHLGYINVESEEGKGTTFTLYFPVTREDATPEQMSISALEYMGKGESILVVDDVKEQRELAGKMLRKLSYTVESVSSGEGAVDYLRENAADLLVLDMIMDPGMDGLDTYRKILEIHPDQKAIIVSGFAETDRVRETQSLGAGAYVKKPYVLEKLGLAVRKELERQR
jgi:two-component system, cell cycle sensor histidine kinase and response regulator CckA